MEAYALNNLYVIIQKTMSSRKSEEDVKVKDTNRKKAPSKKTPAPRKSTNMGVWTFGTLNQLFIKGSLTETKLSKK